METSTASLKAGAKRFYDASVDLRTGKINADQCRAIFRELREAHGEQGMQLIKCSAIRSMDR